MEWFWLGGGYQTVKGPRALLSSVLKPDCDLEIKMEGQTKLFSHSSPPACQQSSLSDRQSGAFVASHIIFVKTAFASERWRCLTFSDAGFRVHQLAWQLPRLFGKPRSRPDFRCYFMQLQFSCPSPSPCCSLPSNSS